MVGGAGGYRTGDRHVDGRRQSGDEERGENARAPDGRLEDGRSEEDLVWEQRLETVSDGQLCELHFPAGRLKHCLKAFPHCQQRNASGVLLNHFSTYLLTSLLHYSKYVESKNTGICL